MALSALSACSKSGGSGDGGGGTVTGLSAGDQARFDNTANAISQSNHLRQKQATGATMTRSTQSVSQSAQKVAILQQKVMRNCQITVIGQDPQSLGAPEAGQGPQGIHTGVSLSGDACPISYSLNSSVSFTQPDPHSAPTGFDVQFAVLYKALTDDARAALDVQVYDVKLAVDASQDGISGSGGGYVVLNSEGRIDIAFSVSGVANGQSNITTATMTLTYADGMKVEIKSADTSTASGKVSTYFINGKAVDEKTYMRYISKMFPTLGGQPDQSGDDGSASPQTQSPSQPAEPGHSAPQTPIQPSQPDDGSGPIGGTYSMSYQYNENGCDTGEHVFTGASEYSVQNQLCSALRNEALNHGCAREKRQSEFADECQGTF